MKMEKTPRYTQRERNMVLGFAAQYKDVIENKRTDAESNRKKDEVWRQIAKEFNARVYHQRSSKQLRQLYKNMKLLLKKDLCGEGKGNRTFMDLLNTLSQQESVAQYISEQMSPNGGSGIGNGGYGSNRQHKYDDDYDDSKNPFPQLASLAYDGMDPDVIVIKSEDISDNDQSQPPEDMDDDDGDCLSSKDIPEVCLEEEDDEIFATDLRQSTPLQSAHASQRGSFASNAAHQQQNGSQQQHSQQPEVTIQNVGGIRVGSIGSLANLKALQNGGNNSALSIPNNNHNNGSSNNASNSNAHSNHNGRHTPSTRQQVSAEQQAAQQLLLNGLGLSAVHPPEPPLPQLQRATHTGNNNSNNSLINSTNQLLLSLNANAGYAGIHKSSHSHSHNHHNHNHNQHNSHGNGAGAGGLHNHSHSSSGSSSGLGGMHGANSRNNDYLMSLAIKEREKKIDLLNAQIDYWKTLTKKLDANVTHNPTPACLCHFPGKVNGLQTPTSSS
ncbi:probable serine/threonine-protein kinase DDB_G0282963 [Anastrepha obliqua]|uniref:probable serine/threonine-protein kinase DDB_G0282963 n=1 Tax=Anastrepha obliqua TaxID=95512 RepID=UPI0024090681|nr:probable serine/threonine-protein kinase DDB_G0282963 [Anastrepha obliqua]XP_054730301.1 probable serine/threonine-protein kinase DDB_G0282963 [Anastrepha obliqua]XP_054730302.1 probable serine/threonine-protein kinase DDB_G0282963 [Anastrepha obliqua]XP_054730303.1 probable serine/threonine-protein kinase DDB_G0282963 [Anastrepha obliqua]XP_054730304.1 probable serine/threonine-protein kinase DDB_G0282963 [Anastrepha obliqua]